jgi:transcriptional regulator with XRE-family HTH domain
MIHRQPPTDIGPLLRRLRLDRRLTIEQAARRIRCKPATIRRLEEGNTEVALQKVIDLLQLYGCCGIIEVYQPPVVETLQDMIEAFAAKSVNQRPFNYPPKSAPMPTLSDLTK